MNRMSSIFQKMWGWGKRHKVISCGVLGILLLMWKSCLNPISPQMFFPGHSLIDYIQAQFLKYPPDNPDHHVVWGNGRIQLSNTEAFWDQKYTHRTDSELIDSVNTRGETVTFDQNSFFAEVSIFRYRRGIIYAYSRRSHIYIMIDAKRAQYTYVNDPVSLSSPHREEFARLISGGWGNYTFGDWDGNGHWRWGLDSYTTFPADPPLLKR